MNIAMGSRRLVLILSFSTLGPILLGAVSECSYDGDGHHDPPIKYELYKAHRTFAPQWAEGGKSIVFGHQGSIYVVEADGSDLRRISRISRAQKGLDRDYSPSVSPDGSRIAYATLRYSTGWFLEPDALHSFEIVTSAVDGSDVKRLTDNKFLDTNPVWSPDGTRIAFLSDREDPRSGSRGYYGPLTPFTMTADGSDVRSLAQSVPAAGGPPAWSPDGTMLAFHGYELPEWLESEKLFVKGYVYVVGADGSNLTKLIEGKTWVRAHSWVEEPQYYAPTWSPDSSSVVFHWWDELGRWNRYVADRDGAKLREVPVDGTVDPLWTLPNLGKILSGLPNHRATLAWSPDGSIVAVRFYSELYTVASDGSDLKRLVLTGDRGELIYGTSARIPPPPAPCSEGVVAPDPEENPGLVQDCETLLAIHDGLFVAGTVGHSSVVPEELAWGPDTPISEWMGVEVGGSPARVVFLRLASILHGTVPSELGKLDGLKTLSLRGSDKGDGLTGPIPSELGDLGNLERLELVGHLSGPIPPELGGLRNLERLELVGRLSGRIPPELGNLTNLTFLDLHTDVDPDVHPDSQLTGEIPSELGNLTNLVYVSLRGHRLIGAIPSELGNLTKLTYLALNHNRLTGGIPPDLGTLTSLESLYLQSNNLSGTIPPELEGLPNLTVLILDRNDLSGCVPAGLATKTRSDLAPC